MEEGEKEGGYCIAAAFNNVNQLRLETKRQGREKATRIRKCFHEAQLSLTLLHIELFTRADKPYTQLEKYWQFLESTVDSLVWLVHCVR
jgi:hypothetical protein